jgi:hypothetical protein
MTYPVINSTYVGSNVMGIFVYANDVTKGFAVPLVVASFWIVLFLTSLLMQMRFASRIRPDVSFLASSFATLGFATILEQTTGLLNPLYFFLTIGLTIVGVLWVSMTEG